MEEEVQFCLNCKRNISLANFVIHSAHCERKIQLCERCSEPVPRSELKNHEEEFHSQEHCSDCRTSVEKWQLEKHKETCAKRLVPCEYCELELPLDNLSEHIVVCGSRTQQCPKCEKHVMLKDLEQHPTRCLKRFFQETSVKKFLSCDYCKLEIPTDYFPEHVALCGSLTDQCPKCKNHVMRKDLEKHPMNCLSKVPGAISCEYCDLQINFAEYEMHIAMCGTRTERCFLCNQHVMVLDRKTHLATCQKEQELRLNLPCEYCKETFPQDSLEAHAALCGSRTQKCEKCNRNIELKKLKTHSNVCQEVQQLRLNFPCKHCGDLFPRGCIEAHAAICESRTQKSETCDGYSEVKKLNLQSNICQQPKTHGECLICHQSVPWVEMNIHTTVCSRMYYETDECERQNQFNEHALKESEASAEGQKQVSSEEEKKQQTKRCSFCFERFPLLQFNKHLEVCSERPYDCENCLKPFPYRRKEAHMRNCLQLERRYANDYRPRNEKTDGNREMKQLKKCQFCNVKLPDVLYQHHMDECKHRVEKCTLCAENVPFKDMQEHKLLKCNFHKAINSEAIPEPFKNSESMRYLEENSEICPSCKCKIPIERYNKHLHLCFEGRTECHFCGIQISKNWEHGHFLKCTGILQMLQEDKNPQSKKKTGKKIEVSLS